MAVRLKTNPATDLRDLLLQVAASAAKGFKELAPKAYVKQTTGIAKEIDSFVGEIYSQAMKNTEETKKNDVW